MKGDDSQTALSTPRLGSAAPQSPHGGRRRGAPRPALLRADPCDALRIAQGVVSLPNHAAWASATIPSPGVDCPEEPL
jgi:hypothetical protein